MADPTWVVAADRLSIVTTRRPRGSRFGASALAFALFASACAGGSASDATVTAAAPPEEAAPEAVQQPEAAQEPAEAPEATQDPQGDTSITTPDEGAEAAPAATSVPPAPTAVPPTPEPPAAEASPAATVALPAVEVVDLVSGENADLSTLAQPGVTLVWFWAPH